MRHYKHFLPGLVSLCLLAGPLGAQQLATPSDNIPQTPQAPAATTLVYPDMQNLSGLTLFNFVRTQIPDAPVQTWPSGPAYYRQSTAYHDGLGRPLQTVAQKAHADGYDIVQHHVYDSSGKEIYQYLPYALPAQLSTGKMNQPVNSRMHYFYDELGPDDQPYGKTEYDHSPLNRVVKKWAPGAAWVGSDRAVTYQYVSNQDYAYWGSGIVASGYFTKGCFPKFTIGNNAGDIPVYDGNYEPGELYLTKVTDEDGKSAEELKDARGRLVLKRSLYRKQGIPYPSLAPAGMFADNYVYTAYVYDELNRLRAVLPPEACKPVMTFAVDGNKTTYTYLWSLDASQAGGLCYQYFYDAKGRMVQKKIPGKEAEYMVYDQRDRLVYSQDGNLRGHNKWAFTFYDVLDRPTASGIAEFGVSREQMAGYAEQPGGNFPNNSIFYYSNNYDLYQVYPGNLPYCTMLSYTYYDDYLSYVLPYEYYFNESQFTGISLPGDGTVVAPAVSHHTRGLVTSSRVRVMDPDDPGADTWLLTANYYDDKGRLIQSISGNQKGGQDISSNIYYFQGMLWKNILRHANPDAITTPETGNGPFDNLTVQKTYTRNLAMGGGNDQVYRVTQKIGGGLSYNLAFYEYDHMGRVAVKQFPAGNVLQEYNIRGFLNHIQVANFNNNDPANNIVPHIFEENLYYDKGFGSKLYNGNIAGITWRKSGDATPVEAYGYSYDGLNRLNHAEYRRKSGQVWSKASYDYTASNITYDRNGNLKSMDQQGVPPATDPVPMDQLTYEYAAGSNQLVKVTDAVAPATTAGLPDFKDLENGPKEYTYDANGNMVTDDNKHISAITYNYLNKPEKITVQGQGTMTYVYDATGNRLQKKVHTDATNITEIYDYIGNFVYKDNVLQYILNEEGRARPVSNQGITDFVYDYFVKDHLGNVRSTVTAKPMSAEYVAEHEIASANIEQLVFDNIPNVRDARPGGITGTNTMAARLDGGHPDHRVGTAILLKVMAGDLFDISVDAYYEGAITDEPTATGDELIGSLMGALTNGINYDGIPLSELPDNIKTVRGILDQTGLGSLIGQLQDDDNPAAPKAHLNYLFFDEKMELQGGSSGSVQVPTGLQGWTNMTPVNSSAIGSSTQIAAPAPGYVLVYVDNKTIGKDVWFDHLMVGHHTSEVLEEDHYYPFGLTVQTSEAGTGVTENKYKLTTKELEKHFDLNVYDFGARMQDMQLGRWWGVDPLSEKYYSMSPYNYCGNNPVMFLDSDGEKITVFGASTVVYSSDPEARKILTGQKVDPLPSNPQSIHQLGVTTVLGGAYSKESMSYQLNKKSGKYDVNAYVSVNVNYELRPGGRINNNNPGLVGEVEEHEKGHGEQLTEAINSSITVGSMFQEKGSDGKINEIAFTGTIDNVLNQASNLYDKIKKESPDALNGVTKKSYLDKIFLSGQSEIFKVMQKPGAESIENDANVRASKSRNGDMPYTNNIKVIKL